MQVFVPCSNYAESVKALDASRINKQILEATQLLDIMFNVPTKSGKPRKGWLNHPALIAWQKNPGALIRYTWECVNESERRGYKTSTYVEKLNSYPSCDSAPPIWFGNEQVHSSHRARLLQKGWEQMLHAEMDQTKILGAIKTIEWYKAFNWKEMQDENLMNTEYLWPHNISDHEYSLKVSVSKDALKNKKLMIQEYGLNPYL
jgi:Pyrimidine dimer DNA glycosylase